VSNISTQRRKRYTGQEKVQFVAMTMQSGSNASYWKVKRMKFTERNKLLKMLNRLRRSIWTKWSKALTAITWSKQRFITLNF